MKRWLWLVLLDAVAVAAGGGWWWWQRRPIAVAVGVDLPLVPGAAIDPSDRYSADLVLEQHPGSRIRLVNMHNAPDPASGPATVAPLKRRSVHFFITPRPPATPCPA